MKKILIINSNYYNKISDNLVNKAKKKLNLVKYQCSQIDVPGVFEIPIAIRKNIKNYDGFIALGCVIKGETPHFDMICMSDAQTFGIPPERSEFRPNVRKNENQKCDKVQKTGFENFSLKQN